MDTAIANSQAKVLLLKAIAARAKSDTANTVLENEKIKVEIAKKLVFKSPWTLLQSQEIFAFKRLFQKA